MLIELTFDRFVYACGGLMQEIDTQLFDKEFLPKLIELSKDKIPNVRMSLSILLNTALQDGFHSIETITNYV